jgi:quinol monooxygenase YgiN
MEHIQLTATFPNITAGNLSQFKDLAAQALDITKGEAGTLQYDWFFNDDETKCVVRETYQNSDAVLSHIGNVGPVLGSLVEAGGGLQIEAFGHLSPELREAAAAFQPAIHSYFQGK